MLITISGMVGSGKSTTASAITSRLREVGLSPRYLRFRYLGLFGFTKPAADARRAPGADSEPRPRGAGFALRRLTVALTVGYAARIVAFRLSAVGRPQQCDIIDRYFYDNLVHYELRTRRERAYAAILARLIPRPDLAILVVASDPTIAARRPQYAPEYLTTVARRYEQLPTLFPHIVRISTDSGNAAEDSIRRLVQALDK